MLCICVAMPLEVAWLKMVQNRVFSKYLRVKNSCFFYIATKIQGHLQACRNKMGEHRRPLSGHMSGLKRSRDYLWELSLRNMGCWALSCSRCCEIKWVKLLSCFIFSFYLHFPLDPMYIKTVLCLTTCDNKIRLATLDCDLQ